MTEKFFAIAPVVHEFTLWVLVILSILSIAFILERAFVLNKVRNQSQKISEQLREIIRNNNLTELEELAKDRASLEAKGLSYGLRHAHERGIPGLEELFSSYAANEKPILEKHLGFLATVGANAPFIGLLGTVFGIMDAFRSLAQSQGDAKAVMVGISQALVATAVGLIVAIPAVIAYNYFQKQVKGVLMNLESIKDLCVAYAKSGIKKG